MFFFHYTNQLPSPQEMSAHSGIEPGSIQLTDSIDSRTQTTEFMTSSSYTVGYLLQLLVIL